jgi:pheromone shutdown-related protein TraB
MTVAASPLHHYPDDAAIINLSSKTILLVGTAHIAQQSKDLVTRVIEQKRPDAVCVELDEKRYAELSRQKSWKNLDLKQVVRNKQLATLMANLILAAYQKKLGGQLGIKPGSGLLAAARTACQTGVPLALCDRDVCVTLRRAWHATSFLKKGYLLATLLASLFDKTQLDEKKLAEMRRKDVLSGLIDELGAALPHTKEMLIDERDIFMAEKIERTAGQRLVAVVGAGHAEGIKRVISQDNSGLIETISRVPQAGRLWKILGWLVPGLIVPSLILIGIRQGAAEFTANTVYWIMAHGIPSAVGALIALAHPATVVSAFAASPVTSLSPLIGAGYVYAFIQIMTCPPVVKEFEVVSKDIATFKGWWHTKLLRIFLAFLLTTAESSLGT